MQTTFQAAKQRLSDSFSERMVSRVSSFDSYTSVGTPTILLANRESIVGETPATVNQPGEDSLKSNDSNDCDADTIGVMNGTKKVPGTTSKRKSRKPKKKTIQETNNAMLSPLSRSRVIPYIFEAMSPKRISSFFRKQDSDLSSPVPEATLFPTYDQQQPNSSRSWLPSSQTSSIDIMFDQDSDEIHHGSDRLTMRRNQVKEDDHNNVPPSIFPKKEFPELPTFG